MSKLTELKRKLELIPEKEKYRNRVEKLRHYNNLVSEARKKLSDSRVQLDYVKDVFSNEELGNVTEVINDTRKISKRLSTKLQKDFDVINNQSTDSNFISIKEFAQSSQRKLKDKWKQLLTSRVGSYENLVDASVKAGLEDSTELYSMLTTLQNATETPPKSSKEAEEIKTTLTKFNNSIGTLGLSGKGGQFLIQAAEGNGNPKDLQDQEVIDFIETNDLWSLIKVSFRT